MNASDMEILDMTDRVCFVTADPGDEQWVRSTSYPQRAGRQTGFDGTAAPWLSSAGRAPQFCASTLPLLYRCICCTVRGDLIRIVNKLLKRRSKL